MRSGMLVFAGIAVAVLARPLAAKDAMSPRVPVLVELFTSEGCSSCPPADVLLEKLDQSQPVPGAEVIVLSEHVDYWNSSAWKDSYSSPAFSRRQQAYVSRLRLESGYTPQMIVDGEVEFVGSDGRRAASAITAASQHEKTAVRLSPVSGGVRIEVDPLPGSGDVYFVLAQDSATSNVAGGENKGRQLHHIAIARRIEKVDSTTRRAPFVKDFPLPAPETTPMRWIAFVQDPGNGKIRGAAMLSIPK
jgi:hypothetical protein